MARRRFNRTPEMPETHRIVAQIMRRGRTDEERIELAAREGIAEDELRAILREMMGFG